MAPVRDGLVCVCVGGCGVSLDVPVRVFVGGGGREHFDRGEEPVGAVLPESLRSAGPHGHLLHDGHDKGERSVILQHLIRNSGTNGFLSAHAFKGIHRRESRHGEESHETRSQQRRHCEENDPEEEDPQQKRSADRTEDPAVDQSSSGHLLV